MVIEQMSLAGYMTGFGLLFLVLFWMWCIWDWLGVIHKELEKANATLSTISDQLECIDKNTTAPPSDWEGS